MSLGATARSWCLEMDLCDSPGWARTGDFLINSVRSRGGKYLAHEAAHAGEAVVVDEIAPDRHRLAAPSDGECDQFAVGLARTGGRCSLRVGWPQWGRRRARRRLGVGGHLFGRFWRVAPPPGGPHGEPGGLEVAPGRLPPDSRRRVNVLSAYLLWPGFRCPSMAGFGSTEGQCRSSCPPCAALSGSRECGVQLRGLPGPEAPTTS
jgi:hypothetical protein